jgi:hypothetical protein
MTDTIGHSLEVRIIPQISTTVILMVEATFYQEVIPTNRKDRRRHSK